MNFGQALEALKQGKKVAREGWNGKGLWAALVQPKSNGWEFGLPPRPWLGLKDVNNMFGPWVPSTSDILANDWVVVE